MKIDLNFILFSIVTSQENQDTAQQPISPLVCSVAGPAMLQNILHYSQASNSGVLGAQNDISSANGALSMAR